MISYIEEISSDVFIGEEIVTTDNHNQGLNTTLAGLMDKEANEFVKEPEVDMVEKPEDIARISRIMKNLLKTSNDNVQISNEKYVEITSFQAHAQNQLSEFQDKLEVATEEIALLKHTVARVDGNLTKLSSGMDAMTQKSDELSGSILDVVKDCNTSLKDYEDRLLCNEGSLKQVKEKAEKALADSRKPLSPPPQTPSGIRRLGQSQGRNFNTVNSGRPHGLDKSATVARDLSRVNTGPDSRRQSMIISGRSGRDPLNTSKSSGFVSPCPQSQGES